MNFICAAVQAFSLDFNLRSHMKTHTGDYHECPYDGCQKHYCQEYKLRAHISKEHSRLTRGVVAKFTTHAGSNTKGRYTITSCVFFYKSMLFCFLTCGISACFNNLTTFKGESHMQCFDSIVKNSPLNQFWIQQEQRGVSARMLLEL